MLDKDEMDTKTEIGGVREVERERESERLVEGGGGGGGGGASGVGEREGGGYSES